MQSEDLREATEYSQFYQQVGTAVTSYEIEVTNESDTPQELDISGSVADGGVIDETHTVSGGNQTTLYADIPAAQGAEGTVSTSPSEESTSPPEDSPRNESNSSGDKDSTDSNSDGSGPGFGVGSALASLGGAGYLLKRRLTTDDSADDQT
jgi:PGF-CTERM protein